MSWSWLLARPVRPPWFEALIARRPALAWLALNAATAFAYFVLGLAVSRFFSAFGLFPAPIWLPASVALAAAMVGGARVAPGLFLGSCLANAVLFDAPAHVVALISFTNALGPVVGAAILARWAPDGEPFRRLSGLLAFLAGGVVVHGAIVATGGAFAIWSSVPGMPVAEAWSIWQRWWISDAGGALYAAPALLLWLTERVRVPEEPRDRHEHALVVSIATLFATTLLFASGGIGADLGTYVPFLLVLPLAWLTLRVSLRTAYSLFTLILVIATAATVAGGGPFVAADLARPLTALGAMLVLFSVNLLLTAALVSEQRGASAESRAKSAFLAAVSHELRTPLHGMLGMAEIVRDEAPAGSPARRNAVLILESGRHLQNLVDDLLDVAKAEAGAYQLSEGEIDVASLVMGCAVVSEAQARRAGVMLRESVGIEPLRLKGDPRAARHVLLSLLSNAIKFTPSGGTVTLSARRAADGAVAFSVTDTGIGMAEHERARAFDLFWRAETGDARKAGGVGMGLTIARHFMALHGGEIVLESAPGKGTVATARFPVSRTIG